MTTHEINLLIERYLDGETTPAEERALALAVQREDRPAEWAIIAEMLGELTADEEQYDSIMAQRESKPVVQVTAGSTPRLVKLWPWAAAACVALAVGLSINHTRHDTLDTPQEIAHIKQITQPPADKQAAPPPAETPHAAVGVTKVSLAATTDNEALFAATTKASLACGGEALLPDSVELASVGPEEVSDEIPEEAPDTAPDTNLYLALLAEVEARALQVEQSEQQIYQALLDELLVNIQQQSNRPELSL